MLTNSGMEAKTMRMGRRRQSNFHLPPRMRYKHGAYYYDHNPKWEWLSRDLKEAKLKWAQIEADAAVPQKDSFEAAARLYQAELLPHKAMATQQLHNICIRGLIQSFGHMKLSSIAPHHIYQCMDANPAKVSANRELSVMSCIFQLAIRKGLINANPCRQVTRNPEMPRDRYVEDTEFQAVKALASPQMQAIMDLAYMTAMRRGDILSLRMDAITEDGIRVTQSKTGKRQIIEWTPALLDCVNRLKAFGPPLRPTLVCTRRGKQYTPNGFWAMWRRPMMKAITQGVKRFSFHDIRAKALTDAQQQGLDPQRLAGHTTAQQTATYLRSKTIDRIQPVRTKWQ
jgi:integrase